MGRPLRLRHEHDGVDRQPGAWPARSAVSCSGRTPGLLNCGRRAGARHRAAHDAGYELIAHVTAQPVQWIVPPRHCAV